AEANPAAAGLIGCGIMAGLGAAVNTGGVNRGDSVAVIGCGGVGNAAIAGAKLAGAHTIIGVDIDDRKLTWAKEFGATHTINSKQTDPVEKIRELTGGNGVNVAIEAVGRPETYEQAFYARDHAGTVVLVGVPSPDMKIEGLDHGIGHFMIFEVDSGAQAAVPLSSRLPQTSSVASGRKTAPLLS
ncbi:MAG: hypothetical protein ETSY2_55070, partial [Candidatus Entotheonella gemina]